jgi:glycosyltransferase involved in cell wall biosynthesis
MSLRIAFAMHGTRLAGGVRAIFEIANRLSDRGYNVSIVALGGDHSWFKVRVPIYYISSPKTLNLAITTYKRLRGRGGKATYFSVDRFARKLGFRADLIRPLAEALAKLSPDVAIATWYPTALSVWLSGVSRAYFFMQDFPELVKENDGNYGLRLFEATLRLPFHFLANSTYVRDLILKYNSEARVTVTGVGVDLNTFYPRGDKIISSMDKPIIMVIIRGAKFKGSDVAIKALNIINKQIPIHTVLVSESNAVKRIFSEVRPRFNYSIFSNVDDDTLAKLYSSADIFMFTSYAESFGLPPLEAMACGTPVVTTDCKGNRDYVMNGVNSLIVPPGDPESIARAVVKVLTDKQLRRRLAENGLRTAATFTWDRTVKMFEKAIRGEM